LRNTSAAASFSTLALFSPDTRLILTGGAAEGALQLWRTPTDTTRACELRLLVSADRSAVTCASFAPDGSFLVTGTRDRQVMVWALPGAAEIDRQFPAQLTLVEQAVESNARQVRICAELPNPENRLVPGTSATMIINPEE
jgi:WD40 repeat protein